VACALILTGEELMYQSHWGLTQSPFGSSFDARFFYESPTHEEALARLNFLVEQRRRLGLMLGPPGSGKSLLLELFAVAQRRAGRAVARVALTGREPAEVLAELLGQLRRPASPDEPTALLWRRLDDCLAERRFEQTPVVLLLDDADRAGLAVGPLLERLVRYDPLPEMRLTIALAAEPKNLARLDHRLLDLVELRIDLEPWLTEATADYVRTVLSQAGRREPLFDDSAIERLHQLTGGIPRRVAQLADLALLAGAGAEAEQVGADTIDAVHQELSGAAVC